MSKSIVQQARDDSEVVGTGEGLRFGLSCDSAFACASDASKPGAALAYNAVFDSSERLNLTDAHLQRYENAKKGLNLNIE